MSRARFVWACQSCDVPCFVHPVIREGPPPAPRAPRPPAEHRDPPDEATPPTDHMSPTVDVRTGVIRVSRDSPDGITAYHTTSRRTSRRVIRDAAVSRRFAKHVMRDVTVSRFVAPHHAITCFVSWDGRPCSRAFVGLDYQARSEYDAKM